MKKLLLLLPLLLLATSARAQNGFFYNLDPVAPNATITVCALPSPGPAPFPCTATLSAASIFSDAALTQSISNPTTLGPSGAFGFWVAAGQYVVQLSGSVTKSIVITMGGSAGGPGTLPRLDQVLNPNTDKTFNLGTTALGFSNGSFTLNSDVSFFFPSTAGCVASAEAQLCLDSTSNNVHTFTTEDDIFGIIPQSIATSLVDGDIVLFSKVGSTVTLKDGGAPTPGGGTFLTATITNIRDGDVICQDGSGPTVNLVNCTPGVPVRIISATTYTIDCTSDRDAYLVFTAATAVAVTLPQASSSGGCDSNFFTYVRAISAVVTVTPTTSTINDGGGATASLLVNPGEGANIFSDDANYFAKVAPFREGTKAYLATVGLDVGTTGGYDWQAPNNTVTGTTANKMACDDGTGKLIICPFATAAADRPLGVSVSGIGAVPGTSGNSSVCTLGYCSVVFDNTATANHFAQVSTSVNGDLTDVGTTTPTNGQPYYFVFSGNSGAGTQAVIRNISFGDLNNAGGGGKSTIQVNGSNTQPVNNFVDSAGCSGFLTTANSGNTTTITPHPCHALSFTVYNSAGLTAGTTEASYDLMANVPFGCTIKSYALSLAPSGTVTVKFWRVNGGTAIPTSGNSINTSGVSISSGTAVTSSTLSDFTSTAIASGDRLVMDITAVTTATMVNGVLACQE